VIMPKQGQSVESCIVTEFKKKVGDKVAVGDILFSYETDKASFDEESKFEGTVLACFFNDNDEIPCLTNVMVIGEPGESFEEFAPGGEAPAAAAPDGDDAPSGTVSLRSTPPLASQSEAPVPPLNVPRVAVVTGGIACYSVRKVCSKCLRMRGRIWRHRRCRR